MADELVQADRAHLIHPLHSVAAHDSLGPLVLVRGSGALVYDADGREYVDGLSSLWNVNVGHGRAELGQAAAEQMSKLAFASAYVGMTNEPAVRLAERLASLCYPKLNTVFFASGGA